MKNIQLLKHWKNDVPASIVVFLVALPLCLGIALASGAPLISGLIAGIVGGTVVGFLSGSHLSVSGPAAGLTVIVLNAITELGSFELFLTATVLAGLIQIAMGSLKAGIIGLYFPSSVIKGMLAAIGIILIMKQIPYLIGLDTSAISAGLPTDRSGASAFWSGFRGNIYIGSAIIGFTCLALLILWEQSFIKSHKVLRNIPGGLVAVSVGLAISFGISAFFPNYSITAAHLVNLPDLSSMESWNEVLIFPDFSAFLNPQVYVVAVTIAIIASLETLLSIEAVDKMDAQKRKTPQNRELFAQGVGNTISGLIGGLPMTAVIVRSTTNLDARAKSKFSAVLHGIWLVLAIALLAEFLNFIPLASLAAILIMVGFKLSRPMLYKSQFRLGKQQFIPFITTVVAILFTDLLVGILIGMSVGFYFILRANYKVSHFYRKEEKEQGRMRINIQLSEHVSFLNKANLLQALEELPCNCEAIIDGSNTKDIDYDVLELLYEFKASANKKDIELILRNVPQFAGQLAVEKV